MIPADTLGDDMFHRKSMPDRLQPAWNAFTEQAQRLEQARRAVLGCLPVGRVQPAPVPVGLDVLHVELLAVEQDLHAWRVPEVMGEWGACRAALDESLQGLERARQAAATSSELDEVLTALAEVIEPLDAWSEAERRWRALRVRA
ncbi:MAG: hypothetical protein M3N52_07090 [Actinomycetota bacterium]|nr:hypothetical protein [Actinomycetota bacterium]